MNKYYKYLRYLIRHKYYVMVECFKVGLYWRGIVHDLSKFYPSEFFPYANFFYNRDINNPYKRIYLDNEIDFEFAWLSHQKRNKHHWQWWILLGDNGVTRIFEMSYKYRLEMLCDWKGASKAQGRNGEIKEWYKKNKENIKLHPNTRKWIEEQIK